MQTWQYGWRILLALALAAAPWPRPVLAAAPESAVTSAEQAMPCHDQAERQTPAESSKACGDGCCADPACDPSHCVLMHPALVALPFIAFDVAAVHDPILQRVQHRATAPPPGEHLRPPIA